MSHIHLTKPKTRRTEFFSFLYFSNHRLENEVTNVYTAYTAYMYVVSNLLLTLQAAVNPLIYSSIRDDFNLAFKTLITACGFTITHIIVPGHESSTEVLESHGRKISRSDTERMYMQSLERRISAYRKKSMEQFSALKTSTPEPLNRKTSIYQAARKYSTREIRKKSVMHQRLSSTLSVEPVTEDLPESAEEDYEDDKPATFRSYRLGTLEYLELEKFKERMKMHQIDGKGSRGIRKVSRMFHLNRRTHVGKNPLHASTPDLNRIRDDTTNISNNNNNRSKGISRASSFDSLPSTPSKKHSRKAKLSGTEKLVADSFVPLTFMAGEMSSNTNSIIVSDVVRSNPSSRELSRNTSVIDSQNSESTFRCKSSEVVPPICDETGPIPNTGASSPQKNEKLKKILPFEYSNRKWSLDSMITRLKEVYPDDCVLSVIETPHKTSLSGKVLQTSPSKRRRKKAIHSRPLIIEAGTKLSERIRVGSSNNLTIKRLGRKYSHDVSSTLSVTAITPTFNAQPLLTSGLQTKERKEVLINPIVHKKRSMVDCAVKQVTNIVGKRKKSDFKICVKQSSVPLAAVERCTVKISPLTNEKPTKTEEESMAAKVDGESEEDHVLEPISLTRPRLTVRRISFHEQKTYKDMLSPNPSVQNFAIRYAPKLPVQEETLTPVETEIVSCNYELDKFLYSKESSC